MRGVVYGAIVCVGQSVRALDVGLCACLKLSLMVMAWLGDAMGVEEARIKRDLVILEFVGGLGIALIMTHACATICCAVGHFLHIFIAIASSLQRCSTVTTPGQQL